MVQHPSIDENLEGEVICMWRLSTRSLTPCADSIEALDLEDAIMKSHHVMRYSV